MSADDGISLSRTWYSWKFFIHVGPRGSSLRGILRTDLVVEAVLTSDYITPVL